MTHPISTTYNIHLVETKDKSILCHLTAKSKEFKDLRLYDIPVPIILDSINYHLLLTSDEIIKSGDVVLCNTKINPVIGIVDIQYYNESTHYFIGNQLLPIGVKIEKVVYSLNSIFGLSSPNRDWVEDWVKKYNKENIIYTVTMVYHSE